MDTTTGLASVTTTPDNVTAISTEMALWLANSRLPRTLLLGTKGMRLASNEFLPQHPLESEFAYQRRLERSTLLNAYRKTVSYMAGQVFQIDLMFDDNVDQDFIDLAASIDIKKNALDVFAKRSFEAGIGKGVSMIMIDAPKVVEGEVTTVADEKAKGMRPYFKDVPIESILGGIVDEDGELIQVRLLESTMTRVGRYGTKTVNSVRVLEPGYWEVHEVDDDGNASVVDSGTTIEGVIPLVVFIPGRESTVITGETPLMDLAELNAKHWRSSSDQDNILHVARVPILFGKNIEVANMPVGVATMVVSNDSDADLKYVEVEGKAIESGREDLKETESQMALYGLQALIPDTVAKTATEKKTTSAEVNSALATWAIEYESVLQEAFEILGMFIGKEFPKNGILVNKEFNIGTADPQELAQIMASYTNGVISAQACFSEFRRRGVFDEHLLWADVEADKEQEKRDAIDMQTLAGSAFGTPDDEEDDEDNNEDEGNNEDEDTGDI